MKFKNSGSAYREMIVRDGPAVLDVVIPTKVAGDEDYHEGLYIAANETALFESICVGFSRKSLRKFAKAILKELGE